MQSSHASKRLKKDIPEHVLEKGKGIATPFDSSKEYAIPVSSHLILKDDYSHVINALQPQGSKQSKAATEKSKENNKRRGKMSLIVNMDFRLLSMLLVYFEDNTSIFGLF
jgi:hypothetical protein